VEPQLTAIAVWITAYLIGSIPFGALIARYRNIDLREHGSGNIGATNVARVLGKKAGLITLVGDCAKGVAAVALATHLLGQTGPIAIAGLMAFFGHIFSFFLKFKGGKGVATALGIFLYLTPGPALASAGVFALTMGVCRYVSLSSILAAISLPLFALGFRAPAPYIYTAATVSLFVIWKHRENIQRLLAGGESKFGKK
jgi:glycerol-3-phosphate acyltransferase PlsY